MTPPIITSASTPATTAANLGGTGQLWAPYQYVGYNGTGSFTQSGGTSTVFFLQLGYNAGGSGTYSLSGSGLLSSGV